MNEPDSTPGLFGPERMPTAVGVLTGIIGASLAIAPKLATGPLGLQGQETAVRLIGLSDIVLAPGMIKGRPRWPWMIGRAALNIAIAAYLQGMKPNASNPALAQAGAGILVGLAVLDGGTGLALKAKEEA